MDSFPAENRLPENWLHAGRVLRSVTHDVNNHLGAILAYAELIALAPASSGDIQSMAKEIASAVRSSTAQLHTVAAMVSDDLVTVGTIHLNEILPHVSGLFRFELDRAGSGIDLAMSAEVCAFPGVRTRIVRAMTHVIRHTVDSMASTRNSHRVRLRLTRLAKGCAVEIEGGSGPDEFPASLNEAREHIRYHRGELTWAPPQCVRIEFPEDTGLIKTDVNLRGDPRGCLG